MHILFLPSWYPESEGGFSGSFFREQAEAFVRLGHRVGVIVVRGFPLYEVGTFRARPGLLRSLESGIVTIRDDVLLPVPKLHALNLAVIERRWRRLVNEYIVEHGRPDVLHAHAMFPAGVVASRISKSTGIPFVVTEHRPSSIQLLKSPGYRGPGLAAARSAGGLVGVAKEFAAELNAAYGVETWRYLPGLLSPQFEDISVRVPSDGPFVFGHVSHLDPGKRVDLLIEAFGEAFKGDPDVRLRIAGGPTNRDALERVAKAEGLNTVDFIGPVSRTEIAAEFARAHAFALTSEAEAFGTVLWEAMATGLPIVSTDTWAGQNAVTPESGILATIDDRGSIARALLEMYESFSSYDSERIRELSVEHSGRNVFVQLYLELYSNARRNP